MSNQGGWSRCTGDGRPVHPGDQAIIGMFGAWLDMTDDQQARALRVSPGWRKLLRGEPLDTADIAEAMSADVDDRK
jgi:hypothetical protein